MDQIKVGNFIKQKRKEKGITQGELADKLNITNRAISKWENGICMPDSGIIPELCQLLNITINDLFCGEVVDMKNNEKQLEKNLLEMTMLKEQKDRQLLRLEIFIAVLITILFLTLVFVASYANLQEKYRILLIAIGTIFFVIGVTYCLKIEQAAGYYECAKCHNKYIPTFKNVFLAPHINRTRYMKCPKCGKKSWNKKTLK